MIATLLGWIALGLPLLGFLVLALWPGEPARPVTRLVAVGSVALAFACSLGAFVTLLAADGDDRSRYSSLWEWIRAGDVRVDLAILVDPLSVMMMMIITGVGALIVLYSTEYMEGDRDYRRFFAEMCFFVFAMLLLVEAANFIFLIVGWALVGLASYLLIGYYYDRPSAVAAAKKAFVVNVIGDVGMVLAAFILVTELGALDFGTVFATAPEGLGHGSYAAEMVGLLLFVGAAAKSAQIPLHTWLPDAMEGPTPVSALIHAATMVTAGVYLVVRCNVLYELAPYASDVVAVVGALTLFVAATIALVQEDIKRVLAWSTVSQIGYMMLAAGLGAYGAAMFHLLTHAFFKALLFLAVGIVIHALFGEQLLDRMGGLRHRLRTAYIGVGVGVLAISGMPPFAGFFSKDQIIADAFEHGALGVVLGVVAIAGAGLTAFYMLRLFFRTFWGPEPGGGYEHAPHASRWVMAVPVLVLTALSAVGGLLQVPGGWHAVTDWLEPAISTEPLEPSAGVEVAVGIATFLVSLAGIALAWWVFVADPDRRLRLAGRAPALRRLLHDQYRFDEVFEEAVVQPGRDLGDAFRGGVEPRGVQGAVSATVATLLALGRVLRAAQTGLVRSYAFAMVAGLAIIGAIFAVVVN